MKILFGLIILIIVTLFVLKGSMNERKGELPVFMRADLIAENHQTKIDVQLHSMYQPDSFQLAMLKKDYSNIWAHLNHLYQTNDVEAGKEYYTEDWFKQITGHYMGKTAVPVSRKDLQHELHIQNWSEDGLVCSLIDSNVVVQYRFPHEKQARVEKMHLAIALLFQGDHWRVDAIRVLK
jgi:hypothetical protein